MTENNKVTVLYTARRTKAVSYTQFVPIIKGIRSPVKINFFIYLWLLSQSHLVFILIFRCRIHLAATMIYAFRRNFIAVLCFYSDRSVTTSTCKYSLWEWKSSRKDSATLKGRNPPQVSTESNLPVNSHCFMLFRETISVYGENRMKPTYKVKCYWRLKQVGHVIIAGLWKLELCLRNRGGVREKAKRQLDSKGLEHAWHTSFCVSNKL